MFFPGDAPLEGKGSFSAGRAPPTPVGYQVQFPPPQLVNQLSHRLQDCYFNL